VLDDTVPRAQVEFVSGGGPSGNAGARQLWEEATVGSLTARNAVEAAGGREPETIEAARDRVASALSRRTRAITARDHETIAESTPGVEIARAHAAVGFHPAHPCTTVPGAVSVFVVPDAPRDVLAPDTTVPAPRPDPGALAAVRRRLETARLLGSELFVMPPRYRAVRLAVTIASPAPDDQLRASLERDLREYLDPLVGGDEREGWPFGEPLRPSALLRRAQAAAGSGTDIAAVAIGIDGQPPTENCRDVAIGPHDLVVAEAVDVLGGPPVETEAGLR
jgi:predicted phage baseplate assembly protein